MNAGAYKGKVQIQRSERLTDNIGNQTSGWKTVKKFFAYVNNLSGREYWEAAQAQAENTVQFIFRWNKFFDTINTKEYQILYKKKAYNITAIDNVQYKNETVKIKAVEKEGES